MMTRNQFDDLVNYIRYRPEEAQRLREALGAVAPGQSKWVTATEAGELIGKSGKWIREHMFLFPQAMQVRRGSQFCWMLVEEEVRQQYETFLKNN